MITEAEAQASVDYLLGTAAKAARARANRLILEHGLKRIKAIAMVARNNLPVSAQEREAYASDEYKVALDGLHTAIFEDEQHRALRDAHSAKIEAWRTAEATRRSVRL